MDKTEAQLPGHGVARERTVAVLSAQGMISRDELMTISPDDIMKSSVFAEDREPEDYDEPIPGAA